MSGGVFCPLAETLVGVLSHLLDAELVVDQTTEGDGVAKELEGSDRGFPPESRDGDEKDILEDTAEGQNEGRRFTNL